VFARKSCFATGPPKSKAEPREAIGLRFERNRHL
jgi:hypothetical protein